MSARCLEPDATEGLRFVCRKVSVLYLRLMGEKEIAVEP